MTAKHELTPEQVAAKAAEEKAQKAAEAKAAKEAKAAEKAAAKAAADKEKADAKAAKDAAAAAKKAEAEAAKKAKADERAAKAGAKEAAKAEREAAKAAKEQAKADAKAAKDAQRQPEQNGVRRPGHTGLCGQVWTLADQLSAALGQPVPVADLLAEGEKKGFNPSNVRTEYARWKKFHGLTGRIVKPAAESAGAAA